MATEMTPRPWADFVRQMPIWSLPARGLAMMLAVDVAAVCCLGWSLQAIGLGDRRDLAVFALLVGFGAVCNEASRQVGQRSGVGPDFHSIWMLPVAVLLPAPYALLAPIIDRSWAQWRIRRGVVYRRVYTAASVGIAHFCAGRLFHTLFGSNLSGDWVVHHATEFFVCALVAALCRRIINTSLIRSGALLIDPAMSWRSIAFDLDTLALFGVEMSESICTTALVVIDPIFIIAAVPSVILLHRSLSHNQLTKAARADPKTGLLNASTWRLEAERRIKHASQDLGLLTVLVLDIDHFKNVNDTHGHLVGDAVLVQVADLLRTRLRTYDVIGRFGGDEFVALIHASPDQAHAIATRICDSLAEQPLTIDGIPVSVTASLGLATLCSDQHELDRLLAAADTALYMAKAAGRNRVVNSRLASAP
ncbi:MAG TPA: GGDEF domain-containing protein [Mycobacteriales bacterium]|nr:GGDEF domain-containing protein [Mycobacteriales bacterium]